MKRKIVKHGYSTLTVSLPSKWVKTNKVKEGQHIEFKTTKDGLLISTDQEHHDEKIEITISTDKEWYVNRILRHLYTHGYDEIKIHYTKSEHIKDIRKAIEPLTGFEIIESNPKSCKIKCVTTTDNIEYETLVKRVLWLILSQFDYFIEDITKNKKPLAYEEITEISKTIAKLNNMCRRLINKKTPYDSVTSKYAYWFLTSLLNISSFVQYSYDYSKKTNTLELTKNELELVKKVREFYHTLMNSYMNTNVENTKTFFDERELMFDDILEVLKDKNPVISHYFLDILKELSAIGNIILIIKLNEENKEK